MKQMQKQLLATAYHEAGHAAACYFQHLAFTEVHIIADIGKGRLGRIATLEYALCPNGDERLIYLEKHLIADFAGMVAEARHTGRLRWAHGVEDIKSAVDHAMERHPEGSLEGIGAFLKYSWVCSYDFVKHPHHWTAIGALAAALMERRRLDIVEVMEVIKGALAPLLLKEERPRSWVETNRFFNHDGLDSLMSQSLRRLRYIGCGAKDYHFSDVQP